MKLSRVLLVFVLLSISAHGLGDTPGSVETERSPLMTADASDPGPASGDEPTISTDPLLPGRAGESDDPTGASPSAAAALPRVGGNDANTDGRDRAGSVGAGDRPVADPSAFPGAPPSGANDFSCSPPAHHPNPVVLVHGLSSRMDYHWSYLSPILADEGYCVFALNYGQDPRVGEYSGGYLPMQDSARQLASFVDLVLDRTGAAKIDLVGHSEGSLMPSWYVKYLGGAERIDRYIGLTPLWDGTDVAFLGTASAGAPTGIPRALHQAFGDTLCKACVQVIKGSDFLRDLHDGGFAAPTITYTTIMTMTDELVHPYTSGVLDEPNATNIVIQDLCPVDLTGHTLLATDPLVKELVLNALDDRRQEPVGCSDHFGS